MQFAHMLLESMPVKPLPLGVIKRIAKKLSKNPDIVSRLPIADIRAERKYGRDIKPWGWRVRAAKIKYGKKKVSAVIKRVHDVSAKPLVKGIQRIVREHNAKMRPKLYELRMPHAYPIGKDFVAMARTPAPTIKDIMNPDSPAQKERGRRFFEAMKKAHNISTKQLDAAFKELCDNLKKINTIIETQPFWLWKDQFFVLGYKKGKFIFMPVMDIV